MPNLLDSPFATTQAIWTTPFDGEVSAPPHRLIHQRVLNFPQEVSLHRLGIRLGSGYCKCGSGVQPDWIRDLRVLSWRENDWYEELLLRDLHRPREEDTAWHGLDISTSSLILQVRRSGVDDWWSGWNLVSSALVLEGNAVEATFPAPSIVHQGSVDLSGLPTGLTARAYPGEIRFKSLYLEVGFNLRRPAFSYLALDQEAQGQTHCNLLALKAGWREPLHEYLTQGVTLHPLGISPVASFFHFHAQGSIRVEGPLVTYDVQMESGQRYELQWSIEPDRLRLYAVRTSLKAQRAWRSSAWQIAFDAALAQTSVLGEITRIGQTGLSRPPLLVHAPSHGSFQLISTDDNVLWRSDAARPLLVTTGELKLGEVPQLTGEYLLQPGRHTAEVTFAMARPERPPIRAPDTVQRAFQRCAQTAFPYRPDTATFANNGISIHVPLCADTWAALCARIPEVGGIPTLPLLRKSLERWLLGAPGYGSGASPDAGHRMEDEYLMTPVSCLLGLGEYLHASGDTTFLEQHRGRIDAEWRLLLARDLDGDGLIESPYRSGVSGRHEWSTNWYDAISFGWKDAFTNALLYQALQKWHGLTEFVDLTAWQARLKMHYRETFWNPETQWLGGWRCREGLLHDYGFLFVNGAAIAAGLLDMDTAREVMSHLWRELCLRNGGDFRLGLPGNLLPIPDSDLASAQLGKPYGYFENGGLTFCQTHHFLRGLQAANMTVEMDELLLQLCEGLLSDRAFGGCGSDLEWKRPDGHPCGYEGLLVDQFGILTVILDRYR